MPDLVQGGDEHVGGKKRKKNTMLYVGGGAILLLVTVIFFTKKSSSAASSATPTPATSGLDPNTLAALQSMGLLNGSTAGGSGGGGVGATGAQGPAGPTGPTGPAGPSGGSGGSNGGGGGGGLSVNIPDGLGGWQTAFFPSQSALNNFYNSVGVANGYYPNGLSASTLDSAVQQWGGSISAVVANMSATLQKQARLHNPTVSTAGGTSAANGFHTVKPGETISSIAGMYGVSPSTLSRVNGNVLPNTGAVHPGQRLKV
jgi:LysM repeat protein